MPHAFANTLRTFKTASGKTGGFYSLPELQKTYPNVARDQAAALQQRVRADQEVGNGAR